MYLDLWKIQSGKYLGNSKIQYNTYPFIRVSVYRHLISITVYLCSCTAPILTLVGLGRRVCAFHFVKIQSAFSMYFQNCLEFSYNILPRWSKYQQKHFHTSRYWQIAYTSCEYSLLLTIFKFSGMLWRNLLVSDVIILITWLF